MKEKRFQKIYVEITNRCNLKCSFCLDGKREKRFMTVDEFKTVIRKIKDFTNLIALHVKGEPLLHPELKEILNVCYEENILVNITTNATLLEKRLETILSSKAVRQLNLSLHSINKNENTKLYNVESYLEEVFRVSKIILDIIDDETMHKIVVKAEGKDDNTYNIVEVKAPTHNPQESTMALMNWGNGIKQFVDFSSMVYEHDNPTVEIVCQTRGGQKLPEFSVRYNDGNGLSVADNL